jgi:type III secretion protein L
VLRAEVFAARAEARRLLAEAQGRADALVAEARGQAEAIARQAREEALAEGRSQAAEALVRASLQAGHLLAEAEPRAVELALEIAARLLGRDLERDPALVAELSATALQAARRARAVVLRVHPLDARRLREHRPRLMALIGRAVDVTVRDDAQVQPGGCVVETEFGTIDGQLRTRFELLRALLLPAAPAPEAR